MMLPMQFKDFVLDQIALAEGLEVTTVGADADTVTYEVKMSLTIPRAGYDCLRASVERRGTKITSELRSVIRRGLRDCLADVDDEKTQAAAERMAERIAGRYGE